MADRITRAKRDARILELFIAGSTYRGISEALERHGYGKVSHAQVDRVVKREMNKATARRDLLADQALAIYIERTEALFKAHYPKALKGEWRSSVICDRVLARQARLFGLDGGTGGGRGRGNPNPDPHDPTEEDGDDEDDEGSVSDLDKFRANRRRA